MGCTTWNKIVAEEPIRTPTKNSLIRGSLQDHTLVVRVRNLSMNGLDGVTNRKIHRKWVFSFVQSCAFADAKESQDGHPTELSTGSLGLALGQAFLRVCPCVIDFL